MIALSAEDQQVLDALRAAVTEALERKRRLGQYAVIWRDGRAVRLEPSQIPSNPTAEPTAR
jgi:hypothetical protein